MYIKQVIIEGFKSYREQVATEQFSPKHNCIVGANGSGKTNFFHAIRFVLSDLFNNLRAEDRQALLHEGAGHQVMSAFVEIVFDNSDNRIPVDREEVRLRRTIGLKKDEYFLDKKHITKQEVMNLLESAGFSRSNPYYVVQQGKINQLTLMKDTDRLELLKEIGGTRVYEERRKESLKIMQDTETRRKQIIEVVQYIEERLKELDEEKEELKKYQQLDKQRRSLEYTIFDKELHETRRALEEIEEQRAKGSEASGSMHNTARESQEKLKKIDKEIKLLTRSIQDASKLKEEAEEQRQVAIRNNAKLMMDVKDMEETVTREREMKVEVEQDLESLKGAVEKSNKDLAAVTLEHETATKEELDASRRKDDLERQLSMLYQKQGHKQQFSSKKERDNWLQSEIQRLRQLSERQTTQSARLQQEVEMLHGTIIKLSAEVNNKSSQLQEQEKQIADCIHNMASLRKLRDELQGKRKDLWRREQDIHAEILKTTEEKRKAESMLDAQGSHDIRRATASLKKIISDHAIDGVHGPLLELLDCDDRFNVAVEVTAGNSLYNVVVESDDVASRLVRYLMQQNGGRITFIPLNRAQAPHVNLPSGPDTVPLLSKLRYDEKYGKAFAQIFGRTVICRNLDVATEVARSGEIDCITMEGSQVARKGAMTGGHYDNKKSKLALLKLVKENISRIALLVEEEKQVKNQLQDIDQRITILMGDFQKVDGKEKHLQSLAGQLKQEITSLKEEDAASRKALSEKERVVAKMKETIRVSEASVAARTAELGTELTGELSVQEKELMRNLVAEISKLEKEVTNFRSRRLEVETRMSMIETSLSQNLLRRQAELLSQTEGINIEARAAALVLKRQEADSAHGAAQDARRQVKDLVDKLDRDTKQLTSLKSQRDELKEAEDMYERTLQNEAKDLESLLNKRNLLLQKREDLMKKIRDLGSLPSDAFEKYQNKHLKDLQKMKNKTIEQLKKFSHVNKKALDQYVNFTEQREELHKRQAELDSGDEKIKELIAVLDNRKDEAIERTFKGVAKNFREVFSELVQNGHGSLVMMKKKKSDEAAEDDDGDDDEVGHHGDGDGSRIEKYIGVRVKVSFTGRGETQSMKQLSGGQKTLVALALIFAIQRCDPAPFYLFDEIDAALDPQYRTAVGNMIEKQAETAQTQFITTTFRPELVKAAHQIYGVFHKNRVSNVKVISREEAVRFIEQDQSHQQVT